MANKLSLTDAKVFNVNLQQGFILNSPANIIAAFSHHHKTVVVRLPNHANDYDWSNSGFEDYVKISGATDSFSLKCYTLMGEIDLSDLIINHKV